MKTHYHEETGTELPEERQRYFIRKRSPLGLGRCNLLNTSVQPPTIARNGFVTDVKVGFIASQRTMDIDSGAQRSDPVPISFNPVRSIYWLIIVVAMCAPTVVVYGTQTYSFSYRFASGDLVTGSFTGTPSGNLVTGLTNISVFINGAPFRGNGHVFNLGWVYNQQLPGNPGSAVASFDGTANAFSFYDYDPSGPYDPNGKQFSSNPYFGGPTTYASFRNAGSLVFEGTGCSCSTAPYVPANWTLTPTALAPPVIASFSASPSTITAGQSSTLSWSTTNASSVTITGVTGTQPANGSVGVSPAATTIYTLTATGSGGTKTATTTVVVNSAPQPPGAFTLFGNAYCKTGGTAAVLLTWSASSGVATYTLYRDGTSYSANSTNMPASQLSFDNTANVTAGTSYSYFIRATNANGSTDSNTISVAVPPNVCGSMQPPTIVFTASPDRLVGGGTTTLSWSVTNATVVSIDNDLGTRPASGSVIVNVGRTTQYVLTAVGPGGSAFRALTVRVDPALQVSTLITPLQGVAPLSNTLQAIASGGVPPYTSYTWSTGAHGALATAIWAIEGRYGVSCTVIDSRGNQATSNTQVVSVTNPSALAKFETLDPNPVIAGNVTTTNPAVLTSAPSVGALAADGATLVLLRFTASVPGSVKFSLGGDTCDDIVSARSDDSGLSVWGTEDRLAVVTQRTAPVGSQQQAFAVYHAPSDFWRTSADDNRADRPLTLRAQFTPDAGTVTEICRQLTIVRPPVVLVHGIWSDESTWKFPLVWDTRFDITKNVSWDGYTSIANNSETPYRGVQTALAALRWPNGNTAATRVDVIAHSMGGLLARAWAGNTRYNRTDNYYKGDYHEIITLNTPHAGSPLANILVDIRSHYILAADFIIAVQSLGMPISTCFDFWRPSCAPGAIDDLQQGSPALASLARPQVPTHAFVGEAGVLGVAGCLTPASSLAKLASVFDGYGSVDEFSLATFGETTHDQVVGSVSQQGGLGLNAVDKFTACDSAHTNVTGLSDFEYSKRIAELLNAKSSGPAFSVMNDNETLTASGQYGSATTTSAFPVAINASSIVLTIDSPHDGATVDGNASVAVQVSASAPVTSVTLVGDRVVLEKSAPPFQFTVNLPDDALGHATFVATARANDGTVAISAPVRVEVRRNTPIESLQLDSTSRALLFPGAEQLHVRAVFSDGVIRDVTDPTLGTTYTAGDESIVSVSQAGVLTAKRPGVTVVTARNGAAEASTFVVVAPTPGSRRRAVSH